MKLKLTYIILFSFTYAAQIGVDTSINIAKNVFTKFHDSRNQENFILRDYDIIGDDISPLFYIYHLEPKGFIIISAEDKASPVLGYGFEHNFRLNNMPSNLTYIINLYKNQIINLRESNNERSLDVINEWNEYLSNDNSDNNSNTRNVSPLLDAEFDQSGSWNNALSDFGFYGPVGCVAVSMSQIMHYWGYPDQGVGSNYYNENDYGFLEIDFSTSFYDFDNMAATYATSASQQLLYHTGISVNMDYDNSGSGASVEGVYPSAEYALENFFSYHDMNVIYKDNLGSTDFRNLLKEELEENKPILYSGYEDSDYNGGHAWNVDGYQSNNLHCNWGWGGWNNGYFNLTTMGGFEAYQTALINIIPGPLTSPLALFEYEINDMEVIFIDLSEVVNESSIESWNWNYGDGNSETNSYGFTEHSYTNSGEYEVTLMVTNIYGESSIPHSELITIGTPVMPGDVNFDEVLNILDVVLLVNFVLGSEIPTNSAFNAGDYNDDGFLNIQDIIMLLNLILN
tara:strand:+ start:344 stop:1879 length:1536 start_codon:yes stop_codon:yes gene_type:complete